MNLYIISVPKNFVKISTSLVMSNNKLLNTINIIQNKLIVKSEDVDYIFNVLERNVIPFTCKKVASK
jgi:hypothetical protein